MSIDNDTIITVVRHPYKFRHPGEVKYESIKGTLSWESVYTCEEDDFLDLQELNDFYLRCQFWCDELLTDDYDHSCQHGTKPHHIYSFITHKKNPKFFMSSSNWLDRSQKWINHHVHLIVSIKIVQKKS